MVFVGAYFGIKTYNETRVEQEKEDVITLVSAQESDITAVEYVNGGETLRFERGDGDAWIYADDETLNIDGSEISAMLSYLCGLTADEKLEGVDDASQYGFSDPTNVITYTTAAATQTLQIGMENPVTGQYYAKTDGNDIYLISSSVVSSFDKTLDDLIVEETESESDE
jgi:hypothetical protein